MPALQDLIKAFMKMMLSGDSSQWDAALQVGGWVGGSGC